MAVYITGDLHRHFQRVEDFCDRMKTSVEHDWLICLGDVGLNYYGDEFDEVAKVIVSKLPIRFFFIRGNHEMRPEKIAGCRKEIINTESIKGSVLHDPAYQNQYFAIDGYEYRIFGKTALVCGGAYSVDKYFRLERGWKWFDDEQPNESEKDRMKNAVMACKNQEVHSIDMILTHTCPKRFIPTELFLSGIDQSSVDYSTEDFFDKIYEKLPESKPHWYFGHYHGNKYEEDYTMLFEDIIELT